MAAKKYRIGTFAKEHYVLGLKVASGVARPELMPSESKMTHSASVLDCRTPPKKVGDFPYLFGAGPGWAGLVLGNPKEA